MNCTKCGYSLLAGAHYCHNCGHPVGSPAPSEEEAMPIENISAQPAVLAPKKEKTGLAIAGVILSVAAIGLALTYSFAFLGILAGILGIVFGAISIKKPATKTLGIIALIVGIVGTITSLVCLVLFALSLAREVMSYFYQNPFNSFFGNSGGFGDYGDYGGFGGFWN